MEGGRCIYNVKVDGVDAKIEVHVDDILAASKELEEVIKVKRMVAKHIDVRDLGEVKDYLGMDITWDRGAKTVSLAISLHNARLLKDFGIEHCRPNSTPVVPGTEMGIGKPFCDANRYAELVGLLLYLCNQTRPDIAFAVGRLARRMANPTERDLVTVTWGVPNE